MRVCLAIAIAIACSACSGRATQASRTAWDKALARRNDPGTGAPGSGGGRGTNRGGVSGAWQRVSQFTVDAIDVLADGSTTISMRRLAGDLCAEPPEDLDAEPPADAVRCEPKGELSPLGHSLTLELGRASSIGLFARELSDQDSAQLVRQAMQQLTGTCRDPWAKAPSQTDNAHAEFHTCGTGSGAVIVVGRYPYDLGSNRWHFSLAVLGPG